MHTEKQMYILPKVYYMMILFVYGNEIEYT